MHSLQSRLPDHVELNGWRHLKQTRFAATCRATTSGSAGGLGWVIRRRQALRRPMATSRRTGAGARSFGGGLLFQILPAGGGEPRMIVVTSAALDTLPNARRDLRRRR